MYAQKKKKKNDPRPRRLLRNTIILYLLINLIFMAVKKMILWDSFTSVLVLQRERERGHCDYYTKEGKGQKEQYQFLITVGFFLFLFTCKVVWESLYAVAVLGDVHDGYAGNLAQSPLQVAVAGGNDVATMLQRERERERERDEEERYVAC